MKQNNFMKFGIYMLAVFLVIATLGGCSDSPYPREETSTEAEPYDPLYPNYTVVISDGSWYIVPEDKSIGGDTQRANVKFDSVEVFINSLIGGTLSRSELNNMCALAPEDDIGFRICDIDNLYGVVLPENVSLSKFIIAGDRYGFNFTTADGARGQWVYLSEEEYNELCGRNENELRTADKKYTLQDEHKLFFVYEYTDSIPWITVTCRDENLFYAFEIHDFLESPTDDWLLSFGIAPYFKSAE